MPQCFKCAADASAGDFAICDTQNQKRTLHNILHAMLPSWKEPKWFWVRNGIDEWQESSKKWVRQPQALWSRQQVDESDIYCETCWKEWGRHVKRGCTYALTPTCELLAIRAGVRWVDPSEPSHNGNPFLCPHCNSFFNHGGGTLEQHLRMLYNDPRPPVCVLKARFDRLSPPTYSSTFCASNPPAASVSDRPEVESMTKLENAGVNIDFMEPVIHVSTCSYSETVSKTIQGQYTAKRWHHGKPVYEKETLPDCGMPVLIYFWDSRDGEKFHGWWFSPREGSSHVWAFNSSNLDPDDLTVPKSGWKVPFDGDVDTTLSIKTPEAPNERANDKETEEFELRWEFDASTFQTTADGDKEDWQPMTKEMNDALEKRWIKGWQGDNGTETFHVNSNGFTYAVDCFCMVQWNVKTKRRRHIRRGEARPNVHALLPKLAEKDAQVERLQTERNNLVEERTELMAKVASLEQEKRVLQNSQVDHAAQMMFQEAWRMSRQLQTKICKELNHGDAAFSHIQQALVEACPLDHFGDCSRMRTVSITGLHQVYNVSLWKDYEFRKEQVRKELEIRQGVPIVASNLPSRVCSWVHLDGKINEVLLIHGTTQDRIDQIANFGFDERLARERGLYGQGVYFADQSCKSLQYSGAKWQQTGCFIIARVILGHPCHAPGALKHLKVEPMVDSNDPSKGRCHSVIAQPGTPTGGQRQIHREFVLFNGAQAYPEMIVHFKIS